MCGEFQNKQETKFFLRSQTYATNVLIALNPYETIENLYGPHQMVEYSKKNTLFEGRPHIYAIGR